MRRCVTTTVYRFTFFPSLHFLSALNHFCSTLGVTKPFSVAAIRPDMGLSKYCEVQARLKGPENGDCLAATVCGQV